MRWSVIALIVVAAIAIRLPFLHFQTLDYQNFLSRWYDTLDQGGFSALKHKFADYNYPYLYLIWVLTALHIPSLIGIKAISIVFDVVLGFFAYRIAALRTQNFWIRALAFALVVLLPSVVANSSYWGQADAIYSAFALGGVYFLMRPNPLSDGLSRSNAWWACVFFGLAVSFKLQAVFIFPVLIWLVLRRYLRWYSLIAIPVVYLLADIPALAVGAPVKTVLSVYLDQADSNKSLTLGAANLYQLIPISGDVTWLAHAGIAAAALVIIAFLVWSWFARPAVTATSILVVTTAAAVIVPFLLPNMHDRYFYMAEVLTVVMAFYLPMRYWIIPILVQAAAIGVYHSSLTGDQGRGFGGMNRGGPGSMGQNGPGTPPTGRTTGAAGQSANGQHDFRGGGPASGSPEQRGLTADHRQGGFGGGGRRAGSAYSSGRGDTALTVYASFMAAAALGMIATVVQTCRRRT